MNERFAVYFAPAESSLLWHRACHWLGRDPSSGETLPQPKLDGFDAARFESLTESARRYGFHATLRSPFRLASGCDADRLAATAAAFARISPPVALGPVAIRNLDGFLAIMPETQTRELTGFAANCVSRFETCRAPLTEIERARRLTAGLSARQAELTDQYGYPYVMEAFRFHMTLTDRLSGADRDLILPAAEAYFAEALAQPFVLDRLVIFHEPEPGMPFYRLDDFPLTGAAGRPADKR